MFLLSWVLLSAGGLSHADADKVFQPALLVRTRKIMPDDPKRVDRQTVVRDFGGGLLLPGQPYVERWKKLVPDDPRRTNQVVIEYVYCGDRALQGSTVRLRQAGFDRQWGEVAIDCLVDLYDGLKSPMNSVN